VERPRAALDRKDRKIVFGQLLCLLKIALALGG
jgi:hypothetical protein